MRAIITNIKSLVNVREECIPLRGHQLRDLPCVEDAFLLLEDDKIAEYGHMYELESKVPQLPLIIIDATGQCILPCWCDSHTHIVFGNSREEEFIDKINGKSYAEIAAKGGGILNSAKVIENLSENELYNLACTRLQEIALLGTGAVEIKSGYGLTVESELKILRVIKRLKDTSPLLIKATFLGAHTFPLVYRENHEEYINLIIDKMLPVIAQEGLADFIDVFCETGFFSVEEMQRICMAGASFGLMAKVHVNQLNSIGALQSAVAMGARSVDHLEVMTGDDVQALAESNTIGTLLPTAAFFLRMPFQPARQLIDAGCAIALASDYNPGSSPSGNMNFVLSLSCIQMKMLPEEAINAATLNGAFAMDLQNECGSITVGKKANLIFTKSIPSLSYLPYAFGSNSIDKVMLNGEFI